MNGLNRNSLYYRGLGDLTYNELMEKKYKSLKTTIVSLVGISVWKVLILSVEGLLGYETEYSHGYFVGAIFCGWFIGTVEIVMMYAYATKKFDLRLKEIEG